MILKFAKLSPSATTPTKNPEDVGYDLYVDAIHISDNYIEYVSNIAIEPPEGFFTLLTPRSSISKTSHVYSNSVGVIDPSYRGSINARVRYKDVPEYSIGDRFGQIILLPFINPTLQESQLSSTDRDSKGFGSTGS